MSLLLCLAALGLSFWSCARVGLFAYEYERRVENPAGSRFSRVIHAPFKRVAVPRRAALEPAEESAQDRAGVVAVVVMLMYGTFIMMAPVLVNLGSVLLGFGNIAVIQNLVDMLFGWSLGCIAALMIGQYLLMRNAEAELAAASDQSSPSAG